MISAKRRENEIKTRERSTDDSSINISCNLLIFQTNYCFMNVIQLLPKLKLYILSFYHFCVGLGFNIIFVLL